MTNRPTARERYRNDPMFHQLVDTMTACIHRCDFTPSEMREAALLASINYEETNCHNRPLIITPELEQALATIHRYSNEFCEWDYRGSCTHRTSCNQEYVDESADTLVDICPFCKRPIRHHRAGSHTP